MGAKTSLVDDGVMEGLWYSAMILSIALLIVRLIEVANILIG